MNLNFNILSFTFYYLYFSSIHIFVKHLLFQIEFNEFRLHNFLFMYGCKGNKITLKTGKCNLFLFLRWHVDTLYISWNRKTLHLNKNQSVTKLSYKYNMEEREWTAFHEIILIIIVCLLSEGNTKNLCER